MTRERSGANADSDGIRLQKVLASAGIGSRRACEELIDRGRVTVDGRRATLGMRVDPRTAVIHVDGERIPTAEDLMVLAMNKPAGVLSTMSDDQGRPCVGDYVADRRERLFHVGRLDSDTEGLLLLTNDGELAHRLMHPSHEVAKTYVAQVEGVVRKTTLRDLTTGVDLEDGPVRADAARIMHALPGRTLVELVLHEGRKHVVRRMLETVGHPVETLTRTRIGPIALGQQRLGTVRVLGQAEVGSLYTAVGM